MPSQKPSADTLPGPRGLPLVGVGLHLSPHWLVKSRAAYGDTYRLNVPVGGGGVIVTHPEDVRTVLVKDTLFRKANLTKNPKSFLTRLMGNGLFGAVGDEWLQQRKLMQPVFHRQRVDTFFEMMCARIRNFFAWLEAGDRLQRPIELHEIMTRVTLDIITQALFSSSIEEAQRSDIYNALRGAISSIGTAFDPPLSPLKRWRFNTSLSKLNSFIYDVIAQRQAMESEQRPADLLTMLLEARDEETGYQMTARQLRDEVFTLFLAGHETTASTMTWAIYSLLLHPELMVAEQQRIDRHLGDTSLSLNSLQALETTRHVIDETLRLYPVAWLLMRVARHDVDLRQAHLPADTHVFLSPYVTHRHPDFWEAPERFRPARFTQEENGHLRHPYAYFPFGGGKRICIGNHFALLEAQLLLIMFLQRYDITLLTDRPIKFRSGLALAPSRPIMIRLVRR